MSSDFQVVGTNPAALFTLKVHRGEGMALLGMNWKKGEPPPDFVGFAIEYKEPGGDKFYALKNRIGFADANGRVDPRRLTTLQSPIQKFRWVHFPRNAEMEGDFTYRVSPVFMNDQDELSVGEPQVASLELRRDTYPGVLNVTYTRGFVSSQAFVDKFITKRDGLQTLIPGSGDDALGFVPTHPKAREALDWMGFEARRAMIDVLDQAIADSGASVRMIAYDLNEPEVVARLERLGARLRIIIDDSDSHGKPDSAESKAASRLVATAGTENVKRQRMGRLQHNKTIVVNGPRRKIVLCGSTNFSWRGLFVQSNNALVLRGVKAVTAFSNAFDSYWASGSATNFGRSPSANWTDLDPQGVRIRVAFSPHSAANAVLDSIGKDVAAARSSVFYSLAFLYQTTGPIRSAVETVTKDASRFVYGISDRKVGGLDLQKPDGNLAPVFADALTGNLPEPFKSEPTTGAGVRMHHKFIVVDFNTPDARVYTGSYNFSSPADRSNGEHVLLIRNRRIAVSYMVEALRIFDHYHFRNKQQQALVAEMPLSLKRPPRTPRQTPWWKSYYSDPHKIRDRLVFS